MAYSPEQLDNSTKLAINMAKLCVITFKARQALADNQNIALAAHDPRSLHVARCIKTRQQAS